MNNNAPLSMHRNAQPAMKLNTKHLMRLSAQPLMRPSARTLTKQITRMSAQQHMNRSALQAMKQAMSNSAQQLMLNSVKNQLALDMEATALPNVSKCRKTAVPKHRYRNQPKTANKCLGRSASRLPCKCLTKNAPKYQNKTAPRYRSKKQFKSPNRIATKFLRSTARAFLFRRPSFRLGEFPRRFAAMVQVEVAEEGVMEVEVMENKKNRKKFSEKDFVLRPRYSQRNDYSNYLQNNLNVINKLWFNNIYISK
eukprot:TRINITY_DN5273_c0_g1_i2.p2 TRINITY_DN5273_c0_g1~~TRINITY_DN5273_c0_g1_i2.p2  ORF type:complete len:253 (+),score=51.12 TRINITY_DN5273_c0_g1_i2:215-973(+)